MNTVNEQYNTYYDRFLQYGINDIRFIYNQNERIETDLRNKIGVNNEEMNWIMNCINNYTKDNC